MRQIKFRGWDGETLRELSLDESASYLRAGLPVSQFTGLLDKNGIEVFENDILLKHSSFGGVKFGMYKIIFDKYKFRLSGKNIFYKGIGCISNNPKEWEIIGNIYQKPYLNIPFLFKINSLSNYHVMQKY